MRLRIPSALVLVVAGCASGHSAKVSAMRPGS